MSKQSAQTKITAQHHLTKEQSAIINAHGNTTINAVAGSGKTTTIIEYAAARPATSKICYLAIQRYVKARGHLLDNHPLRGAQIIPHICKLLRLRTQQLDGEVHGSRPVAPDKPPHDGVSFESAQKMTYTLHAMTLHCTKRSAAQESG